MTAPKPDPHAAAAAYVDRSWQTAPIEDLVAAFTAAYDAKDYVAAAWGLRRLHSRTMAEHDAAMAAANGAATLNAPTGDAQP